MTEQAKIKINYVVYTTILKVEEVFENKYIRGYGYSAEFVQVSKGWYVHFDGSYEAIHMGSLRPNLSVGDKIKITFERMDDATQIEGASNV